MRTYQFSFALFYLFVLHALADVTPPYSSKEMAQRSMLIFDGKVLEIQQINTENIPVQNGAPVIVNNYQGKVHVIAVRKGSLGIEQMKTMEIFVRWRDTSDPRYRGERGPDIKVGETHTFFVEAIGHDERDEPLPFLQGNNNVRAPIDTDATRTPGRQSVSSLSTGPSQSQMMPNTTTAAQTGSEPSSPAGQTAGSGDLRLHESGSGWWRRSAPWIGVAVLFVALLVYFWKRSR